MDPDSDPPKICQGLCDGVLNYAKIAQLTVMFIKFATNCKLFS